MFKALFIGMIFSATVAWLLIRRLREVPWEHKGVLPASQDSLTSSAPKVGLWAFMAMVASLFLIFNSAYLMRMGSGHGEIADWVPLNEPWLLWLNSFVLIFASLAMQLATNCANRNDLRGMRTWYTGGGILTILFLFGQGMAWLDLYETGRYDHMNPAYSFFVLLTAAHGLHLLGGLVVLARTAARIWRGLDGAGVVTVGKIRQSVQLTTTYWHFLLLVWFGLFTLLSVT